MYGLNNSKPDNYLQKLTKRFVAEYVKRQDQSEDKIVVRNLSLGPDVPDVIPLTVASIDYDLDDRNLHHTEKFELFDGSNYTPIFRRGQSFLMNVHFTDTYSPDNDLAHLTFSYGPVPSFFNGTQFRIPLTQVEETDVEQWSVFVVENKESVVKLKINCPPKSQVGVWRFKLELGKKGTTNTTVYEHDDNLFYILFNPWCKADEVFLEDDDARREYILCDFGDIYSGTEKQTVTQSWIFGQFDYTVLPVVMLLLERSDVKHSERGSAVRTARALAAVINANDEWGLVDGKWAEEYAGGTPPDQWTGSVAIYEEYLRSGAKSVRYGQCWVFAACVTTACRALGIPCRSVTCFQSAHDANQNLTMEVYLDKNNQVLDDVPGRVTPDSVWNFHCWNEVWFVRSDLPPGYSGWQVIDATPQEKSGGLMQVGPAPVKAILEGEMGLSYDVPFVFAEVNADKFYFREDSNSTWGFSLVYVDQDTVGKSILTQGLGKEPLELVGAYKYAEGSAKEREIFYKALKKIPTAQAFYDKYRKISEPKMSMKFHEMTLVKHGDSFDVSLALENHSSQVATVEVSLSAVATLYNGQEVSLVKQLRIVVTIEAKKIAHVTMNLTEIEYGTALQNTSFIMVTAQCNVRETQEVLKAENSFQIIRPTLDIQVPATTHVGDSLKAKFAFKNPCQKELTNCKLVIEVLYVERKKEIHIGNVAVGGEVAEEVELTASQSGSCVIIGVFSCDQISSIRGSAQFNIVE